MQEYREEIGLKGLL